MFSDSWINFPRQINLIALAKYKLNSTEFIMIEIIMVLLIIGIINIGIIN